MIRRRPGKRHASVGHIAWLLIAFLCSGIVTTSIVVAKDKDKEADDQAKGKEMGPDLSKRKEPRSTKSSENIARQYSREEQEAFRRLVGDGAILGRGLLQITHPTGIFESIEPTRIDVTDDQAMMTVRLTTYWRGGISNSPYATTFSFSVSKIKGYDRLFVVRDNALIRISVENLRQADAYLMQELKIVKTLPSKENARASPDPEIKKKEDHNPIVFGTQFAPR